MKLFVRIKHWQLFLLLFGIPLVLLFTLPDEIILDNSIKGLRFMVAAVTVYLAILLSWIWSLGKNLHQILHYNISSKSRFVMFNVSVLFIITDIIFIFWAILNYAGSTELPAFLFPALVIGHIIAMFCVFFSSAFIAKTLKMVELKRAVTKGEWFGDALLLLAYPLGIWVIQPRVNNIFTK
jgi:hypothetical protein